MNSEHQERVETGTMQVDQGVAASAGSSKCLFEDSIRGRKVVAADGQIVGEVADLMLNYATWQIESVQLKLDKEIADNLGIPRSLMRAATIDLPVHMIQSVGDAVLLTAPTRQLRPSLSRPNKAAA
jgi:sporulation protein YlmC with PRC-barrel domain